MIKREGLQVMKKMKGEKHKDVPVLLNSGPFTALFLLILLSPHRSTCVFLSMRCITPMSVSVTLLASMTAAVPLST